LHRRVQRDRAVFVQRIAFVIDLFGVARERVAGHATDDFERLLPRFFVGAASVIIDTARRLDLVR